jgi:hypothetical protein
VLIALLAAFVPLGTIVEVVNIGTLFAFILVNVGVIILRRTRPDMPRPYRVPLSPVFPLLGVAFAIYLMKDLPLATWIRFVVWLAAGLAIYALYGYRHSRLRELDEVDVLCCGSRGYGPARRVLLGGVSSRLVRRRAARSSWYRGPSSCRVPARRRSRQWPVTARLGVQQLLVRCPSEFPGVLTRRRNRG